MNILIINGGSIDRAFALDFLKKNVYDFIIAVDKGAQFCLEENVLPNLLLGDFDSLPKPMLSWYEHHGIAIRKFLPEKDYSDLEIALAEAYKISEGEKKRSTAAEEKDKVSILGGTGTRLDHICGTIHCMAAAADKLSCELIDRHNKVRIMQPGMYRIRRTDCFGEYISLFPFAGAVKGLTLKGFKYPLTEHSLECGNSLGLSNELREAEGTITFTKGTLILFETRDT